MSNNSKLDVKQMRYIGKEKFTYGVRLDINFDDIFEAIHHFGGVIGFDEKGELAGGKPRFNALHPKTHCEMPLLSKDYYLIGFTDTPSSLARYYKFVFGECTIEYINEKSEISNYDFFAKELTVLESL